METVRACIFVAFALTVAGAPTYPEAEEVQYTRQYPEEYLHFREPRSQYIPQYVSPCAAAAAAAAVTNPVHLNAFAAPYHLNVPGYAVPQFGYGAPRYRSVDEQMAEPEMLAFSDMDQFQHGQAMKMDHIPMARSGYGAPAASTGLAVNGPLLTSASGPAYGIFPNANVGGCNVPLLFSCSPSISSGRIVDSPHAVSGVASNSYRLVEEQPHHDIHHQSEEDLDQHAETSHESSHVLQAHT